MEGPGQEVASLPGALKATFGLGFAGRTGALTEKRGRVARVGCGGLEGEAWVTPYYSMGRAGSRMGFAGCSWARVCAHHVCSVHVSRDVGVIVPMLLTQRL